MTGRFPRRAPDYRLEQLDHELLLYHAGKTTALYLSETASLVWHLCDGRHSDRDIMNLLAEAFPETGGSVAADVESTLRRLEQEGAIEFA